MIHPGFLDPSGRAKPPDPVEPPDGSGQASYETTVTFRGNRPPMVLVRIATGQGASAQTYTATAVAVPDSEG